MPNYDASQLASWGRSLKTAYSEQGKDLTEGLMKTAQEHDLNPHQIRRVAESANILTYQDGLASRGSGEPRFDLANADHVIKALNAPTKTASINTDYAYPPKNQGSTSGLSILSNYMDSVPGARAGLEKQAAHQELMKVSPDDRPLTKTEAYGVIRKLGAAQDELMFRRYNLNKLSKEARASFQGLVRRLVREDGYRIEDLYKAATLARPDAREELRTLFSEAMSKMASQGEIEGFPKTAEPVSAQMISSKIDQLLPSGVKMHILNGEHPVTLSINNVLDLSKRLVENDLGINMLAGKLERAKKVITSIGGM